MATTWLLLLGFALTASAQQKEASVFMPPLTDADKPAPVLEVEPIVCLTNADVDFLYPGRFYLLLPCIEQKEYRRLRDRRRKRLERDERMRWTARRRMTGRDGASAAVPFHVLAKGSLRA